MKQNNCLTHHYTLYIKLLQTIQVVAHSIESILKEMKKEDTEIEDVVMADIENLLNELNIKKSDSDFSSLEQKYDGIKNNQESVGIILNTIKKEITELEDVTVADVENLLRNLNIKKNIADNIEGLNICFDDFEVNL